MPENLRLDIPVVAPAYVWMTVLGNMQLALRHPSNTGESAEIARQFGDRLLEKLIAEGVFSQDEAAQIWRDELNCNCNLPVTLFLPIARNRKPPAES